MLCFICFRRYQAFDYIDMDLSAYNQILWNIVHGSTYSSMLGVNFLGHHAHFIFFLIAPIYFLFQSPLTLLVLQTFALSATALPIYMIAREELGEKLATGVVFMYLLYPAMQHANCFEFHVPVFAALFLAWMFYYYWKNDYKRFMVFLVLSLLCQENIPLIIAPFAFFALLDREKPDKLKWAGGPLLIAGGFFLLVVGKLMPFLNQDRVQFVSIYRHLGKDLPEIVLFLLFHPLKTLQILFAPEKLEYLFKLFVPLFFLPLLDARLAITALLFVQHLLSSRAAEYMIEYHYAAELLPFIFIALIYALKKVTRVEWIRKHIRIEIMVLFLTAVSLTSMIVYGPLLEIVFNPKRMSRDYWDYQKERLLRMIPPDASVVATFEFLPELSSRKEVYSFHHVVHGYYTLSQTPYVLPKSVEYALLDVADPIGVNVFYKRGRSEKNFQEFLSRRSWTMVEMLGNLVLLKQGGASTPEFYGIVDDLPGSVKKNYACVNNELEFLGVNFIDQHVLEKGVVFTLEFFWRAKSKIETDYQMVLELAQDDKIISRTMRPLCYRLMPAYLWPVNKIVGEKYNLFIPKEADLASVVLSAKIIDAKDQTDFIWQVPELGPMPMIMVWEGNSDAGNSM